MCGIIKILYQRQSSCKILFRNMNAGKFGINIILQRITCQKTGILKIRWKLTFTFVYLKFNNVMTSYFIIS